MTFDQYMGQSRRFLMQQVRADRNKLIERKHRAKVRGIFGGADMHRRYWGKWDNAARRAWKRWCKTRDAAKKWGLIEQVRPQYSVVQEFKIIG